MASDGEQPGQQRPGCRVELAGTSPEGEEGVLDDLGRDLPVADESHHRAEDEAGVPVVRDHERGLIAARDPCHEARVIEVPRFVARAAVGHPPLVVHMGGWSAPVRHLSSRPCSRPSPSQSDAQ
jgi:hypothetical protein